MSLPPIFARAGARGGGIAGEGFLDHLARMDRGAVDGADHDAWAGDGARRARSGGFGHDS